MGEEVGRIRGSERERGGMGADSQSGRVHTPFAISLASKTTKSVSPLVQLLRYDRIYPSSSSASGATK